MTGWKLREITMAPMLYAGYRTGCWLLDHPQRGFEFEFSWIWFTQTALHTWQPLLLGSLMLGSIAALIANVAVRILWRLLAIRKWKTRRRN